MCVGEGTCAEGQGKTSRTKQADEEIEAEPRKHIQQMEMRANNNREDGPSVQSKDNQADDLGNQDKKKKMKMKKVANNLRTRHSLAFVAYALRWRNEDKRPTT